jgi:hypothetical protein
MKSTRINIIKPFNLKACSRLFNQETSLFNGMDVACCDYRSSLTRNVLEEKVKIGRQWQSCGKAPADEVCGDHIKRRTNGYMIDEP